MTEYELVLSFLLGQGPVTPGTSSVTLCAALVPDARDLCRVFVFVRFMGWDRPWDAADV